jgi:hypothetical protein
MILISATVTDWSVQKLYGLPGQSGAIQICPSTVAVLKSGNERPNGQRFSITSL